eukprot:GDKI01006388.1.p1 GENE.GDKI01006388.1~~GDKI01006388.1.p1  ORF type:complete len:280 (-),score=98.97 GDKI01006388.1:199-1038(-)
MVKHVSKRSKKEEYSEEESEVDQAAAEEARKKLHRIPFEQLKKMQKEGFAKAARVQHPRFSREEKEDEGGEKKKNESSSKSKKPMEVSSKAPVAVPREWAAKVEGLHKKPKTRDPRFSDLSGTFNSELFSKSYAFLDDYRKKELATLEQSLKGGKGGKKKKGMGVAHLTHEERDRAARMLDRMKSTEAARKQLTDHNLVKRQLRKEEKERVLKTGKKPFFAGESQIKKKMMENKYKALKEQGAGQLDRFIEKKRKHQASKERKTLPFVRRSAQNDRMED